MQISHMKNKKILLLLLGFLLLVVGGFVGYKALVFAMNKYHYLREKLETIESYIEDNPIDYDFSYECLDNNVLIAHAFGGKGTKTYTNALEAFLYNYELGHRVFEVDFDVTEDNVTICSHDEKHWRYITNNEESDARYNYETFKNTPLFTDYTPMDYMDVVNLLNDYPDIIIVTDTKYFDELHVYQQFTQIVDYAKKVNPEVLDRIVPQIYTKQMLTYVQNVYDFKSLIFTLYRINWEADDIATFCIKNGIGFITVSSSRIEDDMDAIDLWKSMNIRVAVHTINDMSEAEMFLDRGVDMIYTDFLEPASFIKE